jgi:hypothetical protein
MQKNELYLNLGSYTFAQHRPEKPTYENTRLMDEFCFSHHGVKMLYSSTFLPEAEFKQIYNGLNYQKLKNKYDPSRLASSLYQKVSSN